MKQSITFRAYRTYLYNVAAMTGNAELKRIADSCFTSTKELKKLYAAGFMMESK